MPVIVFLPGLPHKTMLLYMEVKIIIKLNNQSGILKNNQSGILKKHQRQIISWLDCSTVFLFS